MDSPILKKKCIPCKSGAPALNEESLTKLLEHLDQWQIINNRLEKEFCFKNFQEALDFTNKLGKIAEEENHHPDIFLTYGKVKVQIWTHKIHGLSESDFILAAKYDDIKK